MDIDIKKIESFPCAGFDELLQDSVSDGHNFIEELIKKSEEGNVFFKKPGEILIGAYKQGKLIALGSRNVDPYQKDPAVGRIRHVYVCRSHRRKGIARRVVSTAMKDAEKYFRCLRLSAETPESAKLYESLGFRPVEGDERCSHIIALDR